MQLMPILAMVPALVVAEAVPGFPPETGTRAERFANPPASARILPLHHRRPDSAKAADAEIATLRRRGFGGMASNVNPGTNYLRSATAWDTLRHVARQAKSAGMAMWLYDEDGYPSGTARDLVLRGHPEWEARGIMIAATNAAAGTRVSLPLPPGTFRRALACPLKDGVLLDLDAAVNLDAFAMAGAVAWDVPAGGAAKWCVLGMTEDYIYEGSHAERCLSPRHYINLLMREPTACFIEVTHDRYAKELGKDLDAFTSTFTDEPSLMSCWLSPMPYYVLPWCPDLPADYKARTGRDLLADVPSIAFEDAAGRTMRNRYDFWNMVGDRVSRNYMGQLTEWATKHGILSGGHLLSEEGVGSHVPFYGDFFRCLRALSAPGIDCLTSIPSTVPWITAQFGGSAGALNGSRKVMCEASDHSQKYRRKGDTRPVYQVSEAEIVGSLNRLVWGGVNTFTSYYRWGPFKDDAINRINTTVGRSVTLMSEGYNSAEVALLYPAEALMTTFSPGLRWGRGHENKNVAECFRTCGHSLFIAGRPYMFVDARALRESKLDGDRLAHGDLRWRVVVLPAATTLHSEALRKLHAFWKAGGAVVSVGACPENSERAFPDVEMRRLCKEMFGPDAMMKSFSVSRSAAGGVGVFMMGQQACQLAEIIDHIIEPVVTVAANSEKARLRVARRRTAEGDVFFLLNDGADAWQGSVRICGGGAADLWIPRTGEHGPAPVSDGCITLAIPGYEAVMLTTPRPAEPARMEFDGNASFRLETVPFGQAPSVSAPSHPDAASVSYSDLSDGFVRAEATILKSNVDTFMFVPFKYRSSPFKDGMKGVSATVRVTANQPYAPGLIVFALAADGSLYLANAGRSLCEKGAGRVFVPFSAFSPFGKHSNGAKPFDPAQIIALRFGFGGYYGEAGQIISMDVSRPCGYR